MLLKISIFLDEFPSSNSFLLFFLGRPFLGSEISTNFSILPRLRTAFFFFFSFVNTHSAVGSNTPLFLGTGVEVEEAKSFFSSRAAAGDGFWSTQLQIAIAFEDVCK